VDWLQVPKGLWNHETLYYMCVKFPHLLRCDTVWTCMSVYTFMRRKLRENFPPKYLSICQTTRVTSQERVSLHCKEPMDLIINNELLLFD
jgi:hypothetical protein